MKIRAYLGPLLVGLVGGLANVLIDTPALWNYNWSNGFPTYRGLIDSPHRYLHTPFFCLLISICIWGLFITFTNGFRVELCVHNKIGKTSIVFCPTSHISSLWSDRGETYTETEEGEDRTGS